MTRNQDGKKRPKVSHRPFPWRCEECGDKAVQLSHIRYDAEIRHDGRLHSFTVSDLELPVCTSCGAKVFTEAVDQQINTAFRIHAQLLSPQQMRGAIRRIGVQQKEISIHLGLAEATLSRWLNEIQIQSRSMDTLLRIYFGFPEVRNVVSDESKRTDMGLADVSHAGEATNRPLASRDHRLAPSDATPPDWNGDRDKCRPAQKLVQNAGSTWGGRDA